MSLEVDEFIEHFGIRGMRWGVRKERKASKEAAVKDEHQKAALKLVSDAQLQAAVNRMNLESQYNRLQSEQAKKSKTLGEKFVNELGAIAANVARQQTQNAANKVVGKVIDDKLLAKGLINPPKKKKNK